ncbi:MAG: DUF2779 domain-containing protein [Bacteroidota bacterium]|nr:DUF2779 domain-containing protein [Bacteroidota bacterium]
MTRIIYEATFQANEVLIMLDILKISEGKLMAYEVKSSRAISETYILDAALQYYVMQKAGFKPEEFSIIYINENYLLQDRLEIRDLFSIESVLDKIMPLQDFIEQQIRAEKETLRLDHSPKIDIGRHCFTPYPCDFIGHCWKHLPERSVFDLSFLKFDERMSLYKRKINFPGEIKAEHLQNKIDHRRIQAVVQNALFLDCHAITELLRETGKSPVFLHVLSRRPAIPEYAGTRPYQAIPFGVGSISELNGQEILHSAVFDKEADPFSQLLRYFQKLQKTDQGILLYDQAFIEGMLQETFKRAGQDFQKDIPPLTDLAEAFKNFAVFQMGLDVSADLFSIAKHIFKEKPAGSIRSHIEAVVAYQRPGVKDEFEEIASFQAENLEDFEKSL